MARAFFPAQLSITTLGALENTLGWRSFHLARIHQRKKVGALPKTIFVREASIQT